MRFHKAQSLGQVCTGKDLYKLAVPENGPIFEPCEKGEVLG